MGIESRDYYRSEDSGDWVAGWPTVCKYLILINIAVFVAQFLITRSPTIEELLKAGGITNWQERADSSVERIQEILDAAGDSYRLAVPTTWPQQAGLAAAGAWDELSTLQDELKGGV